MKNKNVYILGAGAMARETYQIYKDLDKSNLIKGFIVSTKMGSEDKVWDKKIYEESILEKIKQEALLIAGIGTPARKKWITELTEKGFYFDTAIHNSVVIGYNTKVGIGTIICAEATLTCDIDVGKHIIINNNATINHDCKICDYVTIGPGVNLGGRVVIGEESFLGIGSIVIHNVKIGKKSFIGGGSVVVKDIPDGVLAYGSPAKPIRKINEEEWHNLI